MKTLYNFYHYNKVANKLLVSYPFGLDIKRIRKSHSRVWTNLARKGVVPGHGKMQKVLHDPEKTINRETHVLTIF